MMTSSSAALQPVTGDPICANGADAPGADNWQRMLREANINPHTGLATDYLNHFNEAIMLLEMIPDMPECTSDFLEWQPATYCEHFMRSNFKARELAVRAYELVSPDLKAEFDGVTDTMTSILKAVGDAMREASQDKTRIILAEQATGWVKPLLALAGSMINGAGQKADEQADVDQIMKR
jgi:hypothetical protein